MRFRCMIVRKFGQERKNDPARSIREKRTKPQYSLHRLPNFPCGLWLSQLLREICALSRVSNINPNVYSRSSPCDHSRKRPALVTTSIVKPRLNCHLKGCNQKLSQATAPIGPHKRLRPLLGITNRSFPLFLSSRGRPLKDSDTYYGNSLIKVYTS